MPQSLTYPGVYIEELPSGVHTITGVATSIAAFIGWANQGPTHEAVLVESWSEFQAQFGGLTKSDTTGVPNYLGYAVNQFFDNGGQQAYVIRIVSKNSQTAFAAGVFGPWRVYAQNPGGWGNYIWVKIAFVSPQGRFGVQVLYAANGIPAQAKVVENFVNLSTDPTDPQYFVTIIDNDSQYISFADADDPDPSPPSPPFPGTIGLTLTSPPSSPGVQLQGGLDGTILAPGDGNFEVALGADASPTSTNEFGLRLLDRVDIFNLLCVPGETDAATISILQEYCTNMRAFYIVDCPQTATTANLNNTGPVGNNDIPGLLTGQYSPNSAYYYPWVQAPDPLAGNRPTLFPPCGFVAGIYAATDASRGVWKAPAGIDASLTGVSGLQYYLTDLENGDLNIQAINCLRQFKVYGDVVWGARTLQGNDQAGSQWKYVPIRRLALYLESSLYDGTQWVVFEPNDETLWGQIRLNVGAFMQGLFLKGAFQGTTPSEAYFVKCDSENNPQSSIDLGVVNILVGFAPLYPAEFVVIQIQQMAGQS
jgi:phage tail sheath protein FI